MTTTKTTPLINDSDSLISATTNGGYQIRVYDDGFGPLWICRNSIGIDGICRAQSWEDAYSICEDEFFPEADETIEGIVKEYGFKREHVRIVDEHGEFVKWDTIETPDPDAWMENELFQEGFGFRNNGPNEHDTLKHGIYSKDLNGEHLEPLTAELLADLGITLGIESEDTETAE